MPPDPTTFRPDDIRAAVDLLVLLMRRKTRSPVHEQCRRMAATVVSQGLQAMGIDVTMTAGGATWEIKKKPLAEEKMPVEA